jgi:transposase InsO family protein
MEVFDTLEQAGRQRGLQATIPVDQGSQFTSKELDLWAHANRIMLDFSRPGKPTDNAHVESVNATIRLECLGQFMPFSMFRWIPPQFADRRVWSHHRRTEGDDLSGRDCVLAEHNVVDLTRVGIETARLSVWLWNKLRGRNLLTGREVLVRSRVQV